MNDSALILKAIKGIDSYGNPKMGKYLTSPEFIAEIKKPFEIDKTHDIPYVAGYSKDGKTVYIDRHLGLMDGKRDITPFLVTHERVEKALIDTFGLKYQAAHAIATAVEEEAVKQAGMNPKKYEAHYTKYIKGLVTEKLKNCPKDLDLTPYQDEHALALIKRILAGEGSKGGKVDRTKNYR